MENIFLTSSLGNVASDIAVKIDVKKNSKLAFIVTASEQQKDDLEWLYKDRSALVTAGFDVTDYTFTDKTAEQIKNDLSVFDIICVEGGNTFYLLEVMQQAKCKEIIKDLIGEGKYYIGSSAGSIIAGPNIYPLRHLDDYDFPRLNGFEGIGLVDFIVFPHWGSDYFKDLYLNKRLEYMYGNDYKLMLLTDNQYVTIHDDRIKIIDVIMDKRT